MKTKFFMVILLMLTMACEVIAQNEPTEYTATYEGNVFNCTTNKVNLSKGDNKYVVTCFLIAFDDSPQYGLCYQINTSGDKEIVALARLHNNGDVQKPYQTKAIITFDDGHQCVSELAMITDVTKKDLRTWTTMGAAYISLFFGESYLDRVCQHNIKSILIEGHTIDMQAMNLKSAPITKRMFQEISKKGYVAGSPGGSASMSPQPSAQKSKSALELVYYPLGILPADVTGITYAKALSGVKSRTTWKLDEYPKMDFFITYTHNGYDITWHGLPIFSAEMSTGKFLKWSYSICLKRADYSRTQAEIYAKLFIKELTENGFPVESYILDRKPNYPVNKKLENDKYKVELTLSDNSKNDFYHITVYVYPK